MSDPNPAARAGTEAPRKGAARFDETPGASRVDEALNDARLENLSARRPVAAGVLRAGALAPSALSTPHLLAEVARQAGGLLRKEVELAKAEARADLKGAAVMAKWFGVAGAVVFWGVGMLFVAAALALALVLPGWLAALIVAVALFLAAGLLAWLGWKRRIGLPLGVTRRTIREGVEWARNRFA